MHKYEIKDKDGNVIYTTGTGFFAHGYYCTVRNNTGYAEVWYNGECIFKTY